MNYLVKRFADEFVKFGILKQTEIITEDDNCFLIVDRSSDYVRTVRLTTVQWPDHIRPQVMSKTMSYDPFERYLEELLKPWDAHLQSGFLYTISRGMENMRDYTELKDASEDSDEFRKHLKYIGETYFIPFYEEMSSLQNIYRQIPNCSLKELWRVIYCTGNTLSRVCKAIAMAYICGDKQQADRWLHDYCDLLDELLPTETDPEERAETIAYRDCLNALEASLKNEEYKKYGVKAD